MSGKPLQDAKISWRVDSNITFQVPADTSRIVCVDEHPVKPWIVTCYDNGLVKFWDYEKNKLLHTFNLEKDDVLKREKLRMLVPINQPKSVEKPKLGVIHSVHFFDTDVQKHRLLQAQRLAIREGVQLPVEPEFYLCNWIVVNADNRIIFVNYITLQQKELKISDLDGKAQNCLTTVGIGPLIAFGGVDGVVRIWDANTWSVVHRLCTTSGHKSVQHLISTIGVKGETIIVSGGSEGGLFWWKDFADVPVAKKSQGEILDLSYNGITGEVISTSTDKSVYWYNITADFEGQVKSNKTIFARVSRFAHPRFPFHSLLACTSNDSKIYLLNKDGSVSELLDVNEFPGGRKSRIYDLRSHPQNPSIVFCCTRTSFYVISIAASSTPTFALTQPKERKAGSRRHTQKIAYVDTSSRIVVGSLKKKGKPQTHKIPSSYVQLSASNTGRFLGVFWPEDSRYNILDLHSYDKNNSAWAVVDEGKAQDLAWFGSKDQDKFCVIGLKTEEKEERVKKNRLKIATTNKTITVEKQIQDLRVGCFDDTGKLSHLPMPLVSNCHVNGLHGGMIIGFHLDAELHNPVLDFERNAKRNVSSSVRSKNSAKNKKGSSASISFNTTETKEKTSTESCMRWIFDVPGHDAPQKIDCPNPLWLLWDPLEQYCLMVYPQHFTIASIRPSFTPVFHHRQTIISALFYKNALVYFTGTTIECKFLGNIPLVIASSDAEEALDLMEQYDSDSLTNHLLPLGILSLVDIADDVLYVLDSVSVIHQIPFKADQLQFYFLVSAGQSKRAVELVDSFPQNQHYSLAQFMCTRGFPEDAVQISSLTALTKLKICRQYKLYDTMPKFLPALNEEAQRYDTKEETVKFIKELCVELDDEELCLNILTEAVKLDANLEKDIVVLHAAAGSKKKLKSMYDEFIEQKNYPSAIFCAQFLGDSKILAQTLLESSNLADYVAFYS
mmetsp:Transcript_6807/g.8467  ORF Transcript_6807/g.8467 Transcript_6807/m.8467 type:complete len:951 (+) Transcript_6807:36-2888(+)